MVFGRLQGSIVMFNTLLVNTVSSSFRDNLVGDILPKQVFIGVQHRWWRSMLLLLLLLLLRLLDATVDGVQERFSLLDRLFDNSLSDTVVHFIVVNYHSRILYAVHIIRHCCCIATIFGFQAGQTAHTVHAAILSVVIPRTGTFIIPAR